MMMMTTMLSVFFLAWSHQVKVDYSEYAWVAYDEGNHPLLRRLFDEFLQILVSDDQ